MICGRLYKKKSDSVSPPSMHLPCLTEHAGKLQCGQNTLQQLCISCRTPSLCRNSRPDAHSIGLRPSPVPKAFRREGQAEYPTITVHLLLQWEQRWPEHRTRAWLGMCDRLHQRCLASRAWQTMNQTMPRIVPIALYIGSMLLSLLLL